MSLETRFYRVLTTSDGQRVLLSNVTPDLFLCPNEARELADALNARANEIDPRPPFARTAALDNPDLVEG